MAKLPQLFRATVRVFNLEMQKIKKNILPTFSRIFFNEFFAFLCAKKFRQQQGENYVMVEKIESYCRSSIFKLEMQKSTSKQPYIFEMETKLLSPTLYSSYIMLSTFFCKKRSSYLMYEDMVVVVNIQESRLKTHVK